MDTMPKNEIKMTKKAQWTIKVAAQKYIFVKGVVLYSCIFFSEKNARIKHNLKFCYFGRLTPYFERL
jgi:hypothetical protein